MKELLNVYLIELTREPGSYEDYAMVVVAKDREQAENLARLNSYDFSYGDLKVTEVNLENEALILRATAGEDW